MSSDLLDDDLITGPVDRTDPDAPPDGVICGCGAIQHFTWWPGRGRIAGRWCPPAVDPCDRCEAARQADEHREVLRRRLGRHGARIPSVHQGHSWTRTDHQPADADLGAWVRYVRGLGVPTVGVRRGLEREAKMVAEWEPAHGDIYVHGPVGTGKSLWVAARMVDLLSQEVGEQVVHLSVDEIMRLGVSYRAAEAMVACGRNTRIRPAGVAHQALWIDEAELVERVALGWSGDRDPLRKVSESPLLVLDDLGSQALTHQSGKRGQLVRDSVARLVSYRWEHELRTIYTSNLPPGSLRDVYGERTGDRLAESVGSSVVSLPGLGDGYSWRKPPPAQGLTRPDRKTQAAEPAEPKPRPKATQGSML